MDNPIYTLTGRPLSRPTENVHHLDTHYINVFKCLVRHGKSFVTLAPFYPTLLPTRQQKRQCDRPLS